VRREALKAGLQSSASENTMVTKISRHTLNRSLGMGNYVAWKKSGDRSGAKLTRATKPRRDLGHRKNEDFFSWGDDVFFYGLEEVKSAMPAKKPGEVGRGNQGGFRIRSINMVHWIGLI